VSSPVSRQHPAERDLQVMRDHLECTAKCRCVAITVTSCVLCPFSCLPSLVCSDATIDCSFQNHKIESMSDCKARWILCGRALNPNPGSDICLYPCDPSARYALHHLGSSEKLARLLGDENPYFEWQLPSERRTYEHILLKQQMQ